MLIEVFCVLIVGLHLGVMLRFSNERAQVLRRYAWIALASWVAEDTCIHAYRFYAYAPDWSVFLDQMPLMVALIWPTVIFSAHTLARHLCARREWVPLVGAGLVLADASLIEPIAVQAGLWQWFEPGFFAVPPIGVVGWACFAGVCMVLIERAESTRKTAWMWSMPVIAPILTHLALLGLWWGAFRWVNVSWPGWVPVVLALATSTSLSVLALRGRPRVPMSEMVTRAPAAIFFFILLALHGSENIALILYAVAFAPPYLVLMALARQRAVHGAPPNEADSLATPEAHVGESTR